MAPSSRLVSVSAARPERPCHSEADLVRALRKTTRDGQQLLASRGGPMTGFAEGRAGPLTSRSLAPFSSEYERLPQTDGEENVLSSIHKPSMKEDGMFFSQVDDDSLVEDSGSCWEPCLSKGRRVVQSPYFQLIIGVLIIANAVVIGLETDDPGYAHWDTIERVLLACFSVELLLRTFLFGLVIFSWSSKEWMWNTFDVFVVLMGIVEVVVQHLSQTEGGGFTTMFRMARLLRILRIFRIIRFLKQLYILAYGFGLAAVAVFWVSIMLIAMLYVISVVMVRTLGHISTDDPAYDFFHKRFGSILKSMFTLFQLTVQPNLMEYSEVLLGRPLLLGFFVVFIIFSSLGMIALLTGVISEAMFEKNMLRLEDARLERERMCQNVVDACSEMFEIVEHDSSGEANTVDIENLLPKIANIFEEHNVPFVPSDLASIIAVMDTDCSGAVNREEFTRGILQAAQELRPILIMQLHVEGMSFFNRKFDEHNARMIQFQQELLALTEDRLSRCHSSANAVPVSSADGAAGAPVPSNKKSVHASFVPERDCEDETRADVAREDAAHEGALRSLQGDIFALASRFEELLGDARAENAASQLAELAELRRSVGLEASLAGRLSVCEATLARTEATVKRTHDAVLRLEESADARPTSLQPLDLRGQSADKSRSRERGRSGRDRPLRALERWDERIATIDESAASGKHWAS